ncbi:MAG: hypothetical protein HYY34_05480 [Chloroflexi bacterium]|nr:hypothetical protein [Chloroflexota bacterium]
MNSLPVRTARLIAAQVQDSLSLWRERAWSIGRIVTALAALAGTHLLLRGNPGYWIFVGGALFVVVYGGVLLLVLSRKRLFPVFAIGFAVDNLILLGAWWAYLQVNSGALESNDLWLIIVPVVMFGIVRIGWIAGALLAVFWLSWLSWSASHYFTQDSYDVTQLPLRLMFIGVSFVLVLRLVAMVSQERRLERARVVELAQLDRFKSSLVRSISHELRTPLTSAKVYTELLERLNDPAGPGDEARIVRGLKSSIERLERIVEQSTDFAFISGSGAGIAEPIDLRTLVTRGVDLLRPEFESRRQSVEINTDSDLPKARGNPGQVERVLLILLDNANRYSPDGGRVTVEVRRDDSKTWVGVGDQGPGISDEDRQFLFSSFYRGSKADRLGTPGMGLGLALAKELIERQGGDIGVEPREGGGTVAYFTLPVEGGG